MPERLETHRHELRRGTVVLACLQLLRIPGYGYGLLADLQARGFETDTSTLYPLLRRLEEQGYLTSEWNTNEVRPRKFYRTSEAGDRLAEILTSDWHALTQALDALAS
ncbi:PadR family transcriptional regulator [Specibacter sp. RAF43]|uniref:PadR family transcriptional regulator n=1 Tax=Specibacter sp. RAF43 TaxID=3233057 RepID=UPI003F99A457